MTIFCHHLFFHSTPLSHIMNSLSKEIKVDMIRKVMTGLSKRNKHLLPPHHLPCLILFIILLCFKILQFPRILLGQKARQPKLSSQYWCYQFACSWELNVKSPDSLFLAAQPNAIEMTKQLFKWPLVKIKK